VQWTLLLPIFDVTQGEAGCRTVVSEPFSLSGGDLALKNLSTFDAPRGDCALASNPGQCITHAAETCIGNRPQEAFIGSLAIQTVEGADYGAAHYIQQATHAGVMVPAQAKGKSSRSHRRQRSIHEAKAAAHAAEVATWASLLEEEMEAGPEREPEVEYEGRGYYLEVMEDNYDL
jgi:hypothetical protein